MSRPLIVHQMRAENCFAYLVVDTETREAALVDPRADRIADYVRELEERGLRLRAVIDTHTHADHLSAAAELRARAGADIVMSEHAACRVATRRLGDGARVAVGQHTLEVLASPGHTDDSMMLLADGALLTGDALLIGGAGRTDFQNGSPEALYDTLHGRLAGLADDLTVYPGHDYAGHTHSTLGQERQTNPLLRLTDRDRFVAALRSGRQPRPANMEAIVAANVRGVRPSTRITADALARALAGTPAPLVVDVRLPAEYRAVHIEPSLSLPLDQLARRGAELPRDRDVVFVCRTGARARLAAAALTDVSARVLDGGIVAWQEAGHLVVEGRAHMSLERQVRIVAGALACAGGALAAGLHPWFGLLPAFVGAGLVYAGITDRCGMAMLLAKLPYNQATGDDARGPACAAPVASGTCAAVAVGEDRDRAERPGSPR
jgi:glyoxylase-like metal-dependent hydrolase (beta-lactamase superfamily II)/rhodanese-related sulfurtransferase